MTGKEMQKAKYKNKKDGFGAPSVRKVPKAALYLN